MSFGSPVIAVKGTLVPEREPTRTLEQNRRFAELLEQDRAVRIEIEALERIVNVVKKAPVSKAIEVLRALGKYGIKGAEMMLSLLAIVSVVYVIGLDLDHWIDANRQIGRIVG